MTQLTLDNLVKSYKGIPAVRGMELRIAQGELVSLLGPSGCGKTTTLRCIAGFEVPESGGILFGNVNVIELPPRRRDIGMVFQNYALFPHMTVQQNLAFGLQMRKVKASEMRRRIADVLAMVQLGGMETRYPRQLSGGQQQRVALARALVIEPRVLLLDEPLANLDAKLREEMRFFIRSLQKRVGITTVYVTHDQAEAMVMSDRIVVMFDGTIHQVGTPEDVYGRPVSRRVASFIGLSNFLDATVARIDADGTHHIDTSYGAMQCRAERPLGIGRSVTLMIRPEALTLLKERPAPCNDNAFPCRVRERHYLGQTDTYELESADGMIFRAQPASRVPHSPGESVWCAFAADRAWLIANPEKEIVA
jgi:putative spermidine/putrescine transport system ATP-binding protein